MLPALAAILAELAVPAPVHAVEFPLAGGPGIAYSATPREVWRRTLRLPQDAERTYHGDYLGTGYFGAFALSKAGGWGYASGTNTLEAAREIALGQCERLNNACVIVAELLPADYSEPEAGAVTLSAQVAPFFSEAGIYPAFKALAVSEDGAYSMYWGVATQAEADRLALADCEANRERDVPGLSDMPCVLVTGLP